MCSTALFSTGYTLPHVRETRPVLTAAQAGRDEGSENRFISLMEHFKHDFILALPRSTGTPIRIAVLDTGLHIDDGDTLLRSGARRVRADLSRSFLGTEDERGDYDDTHGHGTTCGEVATAAHSA